MSTLTTDGAVQVQSMGGEDQEATVLRGLAAHLRRTNGATVEERESTLVFSGADIGLRWLLIGAVTAEGTIRVCSFGQLTTVSYEAKLRASPFRLVMVLALCGAGLGVLMGSASRVVLAAAMFGLLGNLFARDMLRQGAHWFPIQLRKAASESAYA